MQVSPSGLAEAEALRAAASGAEHPTSLLGLSGFGALALRVPENSWWRLGLLVAM